MQTLFEIGEIRDQDRLVALWEIGSNYSLFSYWDAAIKNCYRVQVHSFKEFDEEENLKQMIEDFKNDGKSLDKVIISSAFPESLLVPRHYFEQDGSLLKLIYDTSFNRQFYDLIGEWQLINVYSIPAYLHQLIKENFSAVTYRHAYTPMLKSFNGFDAADQIHVHFSNNQFRVLVKKDNLLQLMQTYPFSAPADVLYYLLKICTEMNLPVETTQLVLSGFIEKDSALFAELYQYFSLLDFTRTEAVPLPGHSYPAHYFSSLNTLAACVS